MGFLHPLLLWGLPLCAVPIIIHLLNRRRFQTVRWAAMEFLLAALKRNKRRIQMEHWILLLLRTLLVALLVLLVARPQLADSVVAIARTHWVYVLDDSCSMLQKSGAQNVWKVALDSLKSDVDRLARTRSGDLVSLLRLSRPGKPDLAAVRVSPALSARVREQVDAFECSDGAFDLVPALELARQRIAETKDASRAEICVLTDFRRQDWLTKDGKGRPEVQAQIAALDASRHKLQIKALAGKDQENLAITAIRREGRIAIAGLPITFVVEVMNKGLVASEPSEIAIEIDGQTRITRPVDALEPGHAQTLAVQHTFRAAGFHALTAQLPADRFAPDDRRAHAIEIKERSKALLVDGDPGQSGEDAESYFITTVFESGGDNVSAIQPQVIADHALADQDLSDIDVVWLLNVATPSEQIIARLEEYVGKGGGLVMFLGNQVDASRYNTLLFKEGAGLLPARLGELAGDFDHPEPGCVADKTHAVIASAADALEVLLARQVQIGRHVLVVEEPNRPVAIPLRVKDAHGAPLLLTKSYGQRGGSVALCTTTADLAWSNWPKSWAFLPIIFELHCASARPMNAAAFDLTPNGSLSLTLDAALFKPDVVVRELGEAASERTFTGLPGKPPNETRLEVEIPMHELHGLGLHEVLLTPHAGNRERRLLARNAPGDEGFLATMSGAALQGAFPPEISQRITLVESGTSGASVAQGELWKTMAWALLVFLLLESLLAWRFGRRSR